MKKIELSNKVKKRILIGILCFVGAAVVALSIPKSVYEKIFAGDDIKIEQPAQEDGPTKLIYVLNNKNGLVGINLEVENENEDEIVQKWDLLTLKANTYPLGYSTPIAPSTKLSKYEILQNKLTLVLSEEFLNSDGKNALASIAWTFCSDEIEEVVIKVNNNVLTELKDYSFSKIDKSINVNYVFETSYLFESDFLTILHDEGDFFKPVTYFFKDVSSIDFMASKLLTSDIVENDGYSYEINDKEFVINLLVDDVISTEVINEFRETVKLNFNVDSLTINNNVMTIYEETFLSENVTNGSQDKNELSQNK